jgi:hypothetical protein
MRLGLLLVCALPASCVGLDKPALEGYDQIRAAVSVITDAATGVTIASSEAAAKEEIDRISFASDPDGSGTFTGALPAGRATTKMYVLGEKATDAAVRVFLMTKGEAPVADTDVRKKPWTETDPNRYGYIGDPWRKVNWELVEHRYQCGGQVCTQFLADRMQLTDDDVRALLADGRDEIRISFSKWKQVDWRLDKDELLAVLDALGVRERYAPAS